MAEPGGLVCSPMKGGGGDDVKCHLCGQACALEDRTRWTTSSHCHKECKTNYNRQLERIKTCTKLEKWWTKMSPLERQEWFVRNQGMEKHKRKEFDNMKYTETQGKRRYHNKDLMIDWNPYDKFKETEEMCGRGADVSAIKLAWKKKLDDPKVQSRKIRDNGASRSSKACVRSSEAQSFKKAVGIAARICTIATMSGQQQP